MRRRGLLALAAALAAAGAALALPPSDPGAPAGAPQVDPSALEAIVVEWRAAESGVAEVSPGVLVRAVRDEEVPQPLERERVEIAWDDVAP